MLSTRGALIVSLLALLPSATATQRVYHAAGAASFIELPVVTSRDQGTRGNGARSR